MRGEGSQDELHRLAVLQEETQADIKKLLETVRVVNQTVANQPTRAEFEDLQDDIRAVKAAIRETNMDLRHLEARVDQLEAAI